MRLKQYITEETGYTIYVDMDGVLSDFVKQSEELFNIPFEELSPDDARFWKLIKDEGESFWSTMSEMKDAKVLMGYLKGKDIKILSSAGSPRNEHTDTINGKKKWMKKHFPNVPVIIEYNKSKYANKNSILIDDLTKNIDVWTKHGGISILHTDAKTTIQQLKKIGV